MKKYIAFIFIFVFQFISFAQSPLNVVMTGYCAQNNGTYSYIGLLNGKNNYSHTYIDEDGDPWTALIGYDNSNWVLYEIDFIDVIGFTNPNVTASLTPPLTGWLPVECDSDATMTVTTTLSANQHRAFASSTQIFPNPTSDFVTIQNKMASQQLLDFKIIDLSGRIIKKGNILFNEKIDVSNLNNGHYLIEIQSTDLNKFVRKITKI